MLRTYQKSRRAGLSLQPSTAGSDPADWCWSDPSWSAAIYQRLLDDCCCWYSRGGWRMRLELRTVRPSRAGSRSCPLVPLPSWRPLLLLFFSFSYAPLPILTSPPTIAPGTATAVMTDRWMLDTFFFSSSRFEKLLPSEKYQINNPLVASRKRATQSAPCTGPWRFESFTCPSGRPRYAREPDWQTLEGNQ